MGDLKYLSTLKVNVDKCTGCGLCQIVCPHAVFEIREGQATIMDKDACMECGACALNCDAGAIEVESGVGCATAVIIGAFKGTEPTCDCRAKPEKPCCG
jgi:NAD-dependent dihydropyrimidine dehydrogenase PreA subunit